MGAGLAAVKNAGVTRKNAGVSRINAGLLTALVQINVDLFLEALWAK